MKAKYVAQRDIMLGAGLSEESFERVVLVMNSISKALLIKTRIAMLSEDD